VNILSSFKSMQRNVYTNLIYASKVKDCKNYLAIYSWLISEKCGCEERCFYMPGKYITLKEVDNLTQLISHLHNSVNFLQTIVQSVKKRSFIR